MRGSDPAAQLLRTLTRHARGQAVTLSHEGMIAWSSATFIGGQHRIAVRGDPPVAWLEALGDADLPMHGCFVASVEIARTTDGVMLTVLVLDD